MNVHILLVICYHTCYLNNHFLLPLNYWNNLFFFQFCFMLQCECSHWYEFSFSKVSHMLIVNCEHSHYILGKCLRTRKSFPLIPRNLETTSFLTLSLSDFFIRLQNPSLATRYSLSPQLRASFLQSTPLEPLILSFFSTHSLFEPLITSKSSHQLRVWTRITDLQLRVWTPRSSLQLEFVFICYVDFWFLWLLCN